MLRPSSLSSETAKKNASRRKPLLEALIPPVRRHRHADYCCIGGTPLRHVQQQGLIQGARTPLHSRSSNSNGSSSRSRSAAAERAATTGATSAAAAAGAAPAGRRDPPCCNKPVALSTNQYSLLITRGLSEKVEGVSIFIRQQTPIQLPRNKINIINSWASKF